MIELSYLSKVSIKFVSWAKLKLSKVSAFKGKILGFLQYGTCYKFQFDDWNATRSGKTKRYSTVRICKCFGLPSFPEKVAESA